MKNPFNKKTTDENKNEDFILFNNDQNKSNKELETTSVIDTKTINKKIKENNFIGFFKTHKVFSICIASVLVFALLALITFGLIVFSNPLYGYAQVAAERGNINRIMDIEGTLVTGDKYEITSLVSGKVVSSNYEVGDYVAQNDELYKLDDTEAKLAVERANNDLNRNSDLGAVYSPSYRITASEDGTIKSINLRTGSSVAVGSTVGILTREDGSTVAITSYVSGTVTIVSVRIGQEVSAGQILATVKPSNTLSDSESTYNKRNSEIELQSAQRHLENFSIKAPVSGIVIEKNAKIGDNVGATDTSKPMMVILDTSHMRFTFNVGEKNISEIKKGQKVVVSSPSVPNTEFEGEIEAISTESINKDGQLMYEVTVSVFAPGDLKSGMKVTGKVILGSRNNVIVVPKKALLKSDGNIAYVLVKANRDEISEKELNLSIENELNNPDIKLPKNTILLSVEYGLFDNENVEIISGLKLSKIVVYDLENNDDIILSKNISAEMLDDDFNFDFNFGNDQAPDYSIENEVDDETKNQLEQRIDDMVEGL